jgi:endonuclease YncB( thermonuclease family)
MKTIYTLFFVLFLTFTASAQSIITGQLAEVVDGKTIVIKTASFTKLSVRLQFIEVPDAANNLTPVIKDHLQQLLAGKTLQFQTRRMSGFSMLTGLLTANGVDVSQQMLRDGAAWYAVPEKENQEAVEREIYLEIEAAAKAEKRGVWGIKDLKPVWESVVAETSKRPQLIDEKQTGKTVMPLSQESKENSASSATN